MQHTYMHNMHNHFVHIYTHNSTHSPIVGVALDGRGMYGKFESADTLPGNLDACNGHVGTIPLVGFVYIHV